MRRREVVRASSSTPRAQRALDTWRSAPHRALVVDDDPSYAAVSGQSLILDGWSVAYAEDGLEARELLTAGIFGLVVLELHLPGLNGWELLRYMGGAWELGVPLASESTRVVATSRHADKNVARFARRLGADEFLAKPFTPVKLSRVVARVTTLGSAVSCREKGIEL